MKRPYTIALVGGILLSLFSSILLTITISIFPELTPPESSEVLNLFFGEEMNYVHYIAIAALVLAVPIIEEIFFRRLLWRISRYFVEADTTLIITSLLFAAAHMSILLGIVLLPLSFFLGWLRFRTDSIKPCIIAHAANNCVAVLIACA